MNPHTSTGSAPSGMSRACFRGFRFWLPWILGLSIAVYFGTEFLIRQAVVSRINPESVKLEQVMDHLPERLRLSIQHKILMTTLRNSFAAARTTGEKIERLIAIACATDNPAERNNLYVLLINRYPFDGQTYPAYVHFMFNPASPELPLTVSPAQFYDYVRRIDAGHACDAWSAAYRKLSGLNPKPSAQVLYNFLSPLLCFDPPFRDFLPLYETLSRQAVAAGHPDAVDRIVPILELLPSRPPVLQP